MIETGQNLEERFHLAKDRIAQIQKECLIDEKYEAYFVFKSIFFERILEIINIMSDGKRDLQSEELLRGYCDFFYDPLREENYNVNYGNPVYANKLFGKEVGEYLCCLHAHIRGTIFYAYQNRLEPVLLRMELFLQVYMKFIELSGAKESEISKALKSIIYHEMYDYSNLMIRDSLEELLNPDCSHAVDIIMNSNLSDTKYLYYYGLNVTSNEILTAEYLGSLPDHELAAMARTYTEAYKQGFLEAGIDLSQKSNVEIRYHLGFEAMVRQAIIQFREMGLNPIIRFLTNTQSLGVKTTPANRQYLFDHKFDEGLYVNQALAKKRLKEWEQGYEERKELARVYAGPAVIEAFGEDTFSPVIHPERTVLSGEQEKIKVEYERTLLLIRNRYIPYDKYSYSIIAYPIPEIGENYKEIFQKTIEVNTLDINQYRKIQECLIHALDEGDYVTVTGKDGNRTNIKIMLHELKDKEKETNFENCLADVNIPVGEIFTSPVLTGTEGTLHVKNVYLNEFDYENLVLEFKDGVITEYSCTNYEAPEENKKFIRQNLLKSRDTLPIGEFAIGTNTTAYQMGKMFHIERKLPILIAEKTGPHFAIGDTCFLMREDSVVTNPDGKEVIAKDNEFTVFRHTEIEKAYFNCHTDITISYDELGDILVHTNEGKEIPLIREGRFVLPGTEELNKNL